MGLAELLAQVSREGPSTRAWERVYLELKSILSSFSGYLRLQEAERDDILHEISEKLLSLGPIPVAGKSEGECRAYIWRMFQRLQIDRARKGNRERVMEQTPELAQWPSAEQKLQLKDAGELLERVYQVLWENRRESYRPQLEKDWAELRGLLSGEWDMARLLLEREQVDAEAASTVRAAAAQRVYKRHSRLRDSLVLMARKMADEGLLQAEELEQVQKLSDWMDRSQQKGGKP